MDVKIMEGGKLQLKNFKETTLFLPWLISDRNVLRT